MIAGLLFLAFAYFAVGQAAATRNGAQTAADAGALAAAQEARDQLYTGWLGVISDPAQWSRFLLEGEYDGGPPCLRAAEFAAKNGAELSEGGCLPLPSGIGGFKVTVRTTGTVGRSIVPGTESQHATASAEATIEPHCSFDGSDSSPSPTESQSGEEEGGEESEPITILVCDGKSWVIDPEGSELPDVTDLFTVRLID